MATRQKTTWRDYQSLARYVLEEIREELGLSEVEGAQAIPGLHSGTSWNIDAKGVRESDGATIIVEARRFSEEHQSQEKLAALAYRIFDTRSGGAIVVNPHDFQKGAQLIAQANNVVNVKLDMYSTPDDFVVEFFNKLYMRVTDRMKFGDSFDVQVNEVSAKTDTD